MSFGLQTFNQYGDVTFDSTLRFYHQSKALIRSYQDAHSASSKIRTYNKPSDLPKNAPLEDLFAVGVAMALLHIPGEPPTPNMSTAIMLPILSSTSNTVTIDLDYADGDSYIILGWLA